MTKDEMNDAIALSVGYTREDPTYDGGVNQPPPCNSYTAYTPLYSYVIDAIYGVVDAMPLHLWDAYFSHLITIRWRDGDQHDPRSLSPAHATAHQMAEAYLKTIGKWEEE